MMIEFEERGFGEREKRALTRERNEIRKLKRRFDVFIVISLVLIVVVGIPLALGQAREDAGLGMLAFGTVAVYGLIVLYVYVRERGGHRERLRMLVGVTEGEGTVRVTRCRADRMVALQEMEDEGPGYFFEVEPNRVYYMGGQHIDVGPDFPNTDFEIVEGFDVNGQMVHFEIRCNGRRLAPSRIIPVAAKLVMLSKDRFPEDGDLFDCALDDVERTILGEEPVA